MFDIGWTELLVLAIVAILIVGPKELPRMLYTIGQSVGKMRRQADEFRRQFNESMREAGMDEVRNDMKKMSDLNPANQIRNEIESTFKDHPNSGNAQKAAGNPANSAPSGENDRPEPSRTAADQNADAPPAQSADAGQGATHAPEPVAGDTPTGPDQPRGDEQPLNRRNANGAAEAKDAVS